MSRLPPDPDLLAGRVADGAEVDWDEALDSASDERARRIIGHLRLVESVARVHRSAEFEPESGGAAVPPAAPPPPRTARRFGHLELRKRLGRGAFGEVWRAWDPRLDREVALKLIEVPSSTGRTLASHVIEEARLLAKLRHPNVVAIHGAEAHEGRVGLWMELVRGRALEEIVRAHGAFGAREAAGIGVYLCRALAAVHRAGVIHRDVKAQNVVREEGGRIVLMDFGAGVEVERQGEARERTISGTPLYMAPELLTGGPPTRQSDIYSLGVLLYRLVTGTFPVQAASWAELHERHARREVRLLRDERPDLPEPFLRVLERALAHEPRDRYDTAGQMEQALAGTFGAGAAGDPAPRAPRRAWPAVLLGLAALIALVLGGRSLLTPPTPADGDSATGAASDIYTVEATLFRVPTGSERWETLASGARLALGDRLALEFEGSVPLYVYVINEDDAGRAYVLFPLPGIEPANPLAPDVAHRLPGSRGGVPLSWTVDTPGGREHLLVVASRERLAEFEAEMAGLARAGEAAVPLPESAKVRLRGIGGLAEAPALPPGGSAGPLFEMAQRLATEPEVLTGVWLRRIDIENPRPE
jgi:serine/threonine-protein kinase